MTYKKHFYVLIIFIAAVISQQSEPQNEIAQIKGTKSPKKTWKEGIIIVTGCKYANASL